jgi:hypothetical protein
MSCCGNKRSSLRLIHEERLLDKRQPAQMMNNREFVNTRQEQKWFRYTGSGNFVVKSFSSKKTYHFSVNTPELFIPGDDVAMMRGYSELVEIGD